MSIQIQKEESPKMMLLQIIAISSLAEREKNVWNMFIEVVKEKEIVPILDAIKDNADTISFFTGNIIEKLLLMEKSTNKQQELIEKEKEYLDSFSLNH